MTTPRETVIGPRPPNDGREWDAQCARCGSSVLREGCGACGGDGWIDDESFGETELERCEDCAGRGGWWCCASSEGWCNAHPIAGHEDVDRGEVEWFPLTNEKGERV